MVTKRTAARWAAAYRAGRTFREIADQAGDDVKEWTVRRVLDSRVQSRPIGPRGRTEITVEQVILAREIAGSIRGAARELGVSETLVRARLFAAGLIDQHPDQRPRAANTP